MTGCFQNVYVARQNVYSPELDIFDPGLEFPDGEKHFKAFKNASNCWFFSLCIHIIT
jgi:hypothetical protein